MYIAKIPSALLLRYLRRTFLSCRFYPRDGDLAASNPCDLQQELMVRSTILRLAAALSLGLSALAFLSSNASAQSTPPAQAADTAKLAIKVLNDHASAGTFVLFIEPVGGVRQSLGTVKAGTSASFNFAANRGTAYILIQQTDTSKHIQPLHVHSANFRHLGYEHAPPIGIKKVTARHSLS